MNITKYTQFLTELSGNTELKQQTCFVTFDQPLYIRDRDIIAGCGKESPLSNVIVRLGGFHL